MHFERAGVPYEAVEPSLLAQLVSGDPWLKHLQDTAQWKAHDKPIYGNLLSWFTVLAQCECPRASTDQTHPVRKPPERSRARIFNAMSGYRGRYKVMPAFA